MRFHAIFVFFAAIVMALAGPDIQGARGKVNENIQVDHGDASMVNDMTDKCDFITVTATVTVSNCECTTPFNPATTSDTSSTIPGSVASYSIESSVKTSVVTSTGFHTVPDFSVPFTPSFVATSTETSDTSTTMVGSSSASSSEVVSSATIMITPVTTATETVKTPTAKSPTSSAAISTGAAIPKGVQVGGSVLAGFAAVILAMA